MLLGALLAKRHCAQRLGVLTDLTPPAGRSIQQLSEQLGAPGHEENGVKLRLSE
jgi:hypothetical protein